MQMFSTKFVSSQLLQSPPVLFVLFTCDVSGGKDLVITQMPVNRDIRVSCAVEEIRNDNVET
jgi:hypothetical protein